MKEQSTLLITILPILVGCAIFMESVNVTALAAAIPRIAIDFHVPVLDLKLAVMSYLLSLSLFIPASGWLSDRYGTRKIFLIALWIFGIGSFLCSLSLNLTMLVIFRLLQGVGGAILLPVGRQVIYQTFEKQQLARVLSKIPMYGLLGLVIGPVLGGVLATYLSWRWIFYINLPVVVLGVLLTVKYMPNYIKKSVQPLDKLGLFWFGLFLAGLLLLFSVLGDTWFPLMYKLLLLVSIILFFLFYNIHSRRVAHPILDISLFRIKNFRWIIIANLVMRFFIGGVIYLFMLFFQIIFQLTPFKAGLLLLTYPFGLIVMSFIAHRFIHRFNMKKLLNINSVLLSVTLLSFVLIEPRSSVWVVSALLFIYSLVLFVQFLVINLLNYDEVAKENMSRAVTVVSIVQQSGMSVGIGVGFVVLELYLRHHALMNDLVSLQAFHATFLTLGLGLLLVLVFQAKLSTYVGQHIGGKPQ